MPPKVDDFALASGPICHVHKFVMPGTTLPKNYNIAFQVLPTKRVPSEKLSEAHLDSKPPNESCIECSAPFERNCQEKTHI